MHSHTQQHPLEERSHRMIEGFRNQILPTASFVIQGESLSRDLLIHRLQQMVAVFEVARVAEASSRAALRARAEVIPQTRLLLEETTGVVKAHVGHEPTKLAAFGLRTEPKSKKKAHRRGRCPEVETLIEVVEVKGGHRRTPPRQGRGRKPQERGGRR